MTRPSRRARSNSRSGSVVSAASTDDGIVRHSSRLKVNDKSPNAKHGHGHGHGHGPSSAHKTATPVGSSSTSSPSSSSSLLAILPTGKFASVKIKVNGSRFRISALSSNSLQDHKSIRHSSHRPDKTLSEQSQLSKFKSPLKSQSSSPSAPPFAKVKHAKQQNGGGGGETSSSQTSFVQNVQNTLGDDGNLYYCDYCHGVGDVVCCDGCPRVYHPTCLPEESISRKSLMADDDPWYCPTCMKEGKISKSSAKKSSSSSSFYHSSMSAKASASKSPATSANADANNADNNSDRNGNGSEKRSSSRCKKVCVECHKVSGGKMGQCRVCNAAMHVPSCRSHDVAIGVGGDRDDGANATCSNCLAEFVVDDEEEERRMDAAAAAAKKKKKAASNIPNYAKDTIVSSKGGYASGSSCSDLTPPPQASTSASANGKTMGVRPSINDQAPPRGKGRPRGSSTASEKPSKKLKKDTDTVRAQANDNETSNISYRPMPSPQHLSPTKRSLPEKATSPFFLFLMENRIKLERLLSRKNRAYKRMKGYQRNLLLSKEGALMWQKTSKLERKKYIDMAIEEFEYNVLTWKEEEALREMMIAEGSRDEEMMALEHEEGKLSASEITSRDNEYWNKKFNSLVAPSQVSCRRMKSSSESIQNGVLLELLQDNRFHSLPMMKANRDCKFELQDNSMTAVPHFNVQGPISTSIGDGCLGCVRGWNHFCPILNRQFPAVEHRAKLQPPCPSHLPVRIGIGLPQPSSEEDDQKYSYSDKKTYKDLRFLSRPSSSRGDEIIKLVETAMAVKLPVGKGSKEEAKRKLSLRHSKSSNQELFECGRCKTATTSIMGCVTCRRVKLLVDLSKNGPTERDNLSIQTVMVPVTNDDKDEKKEGLQGLLCGLVQVLVIKLDLVEVESNADRIMTCLLQVLQIKNATCRQEAFSAVSAVCDKMKAKFNKYKVRNNFLNEKIPRTGETGGSQLVSSSSSYDATATTTATVSPSSLYDATATATATATKENQALQSL